jgi:hypothetical protein
VPELVGTLDAEEARTAPPAKRRVALQQLLLAHHALCALAVDLPAQLAARQRGDHPRAVGRVRARDLDGSADRPDRRRHAAPSSVAASMSGTGPSG